MLDCPRIWRVMDVAEALEVSRLTVSIWKNAASGPKGQTGVRAA